jgi:uncharacterized protein YaaN involved in tellurite resistance
MTTGTEIAALPLDATKVAAIKSEININDTAQLTAFGEGAQREVAGFSDRILSQAQNRELGDTGALLTDVIAKAKGLDPASLQKADIFTRLLGGARRQLLRFQSRFETVAAQIDGIMVELEKRIDLLRRDVTLLDGLHNQTRDSIGALDAYISAGKAFVGEYRTGPLAELQAKAKSTANGVAT